MPLGVESKMIMYGSVLLFNLIQAHVRHEVIKALPEFVQYGVNR